jgi:hypothetical protein
MSLSTNTSASTSTSDHQAGQRAHLHLTAEANSIDDRDTEDRFRYGAVYDYFPRAFTEIRAGDRQRDSNDNDAALNATESFVQVHFFF